jgi:Protein of unknown function (DUF5818)
MSQSKVLRVRSVEVALLEKREPPQLAITAQGTVPTPGWKAPALIPYVYIQPPPDGIYDFDFVAEPPGGLTPQVLTPIAVRHTVPSVPVTLMGVRIHASTNSQEALLGETGGGSGTICVRGTLTDEGIECQALRTDTGELYTLVGNLGGFTIGDQVYVAGTLAAVSFCMQGMTIVVSWISKGAPKV